jgi:hypothetical protein
MKIYPKLQELRSDAGVAAGPHPYPNVMFNIQANYISVTT